MKKMEYLVTIFEKNYGFDAKCDTIRLHDVTSDYKDGFVKALEIVYGEKKIQVTEIK